MIGKTMIDRLALESVKPGMNRLLDVASLSKIGFPVSATS
jgi:hypothetical protein